MKWKSVVMVALFACALGIQPLPDVARAADGDAAAASPNADKFWDYAMCGAAIVFASGTGTWVFAFITCGKAVAEHWAD